MAVESVARWVVQDEEEPWEEFALLAGFTLHERPGLLAGYALCVPGVGCELWLPAGLNCRARGAQIKALLCDLYAQAFPRSRTVGQLRDLVAVLTLGPAAEGAAAD